MEALGVYIPIDRRQAMARGGDLPDRTRGAALFADVSGFTPLTEALVQELGPRRGADELTRQLNRVFDVLIGEVHRYGGSVLAFAGDAITCWFDGDSGLQATACGLAMQKAMEQFAVVKTPSGKAVSLAMKAAVADGPVRRFQIGDPTVQYIDVLAGATLNRMVAGEHLAERGEVIVGPETLAVIGDQVAIAEWRTEGDTGERYGVVIEVVDRVAEAPWPALSPDTLTEAQLRGWLLPPVYARLRAGQGRFLAELRPAVALFMNFRGLDYDEDDAAGEKLDAYIRWVQGVLSRQESYMLQLITGDKGSYLYAAFGAPLAHEDDPCRAVAAAMDLQSLPPELDFVHDVRIGISQGRMRAGDYGGSTRRTYGVLSDEVNIAARLMGIAEPGQILVTQRIARNARRNCRFEDLGQISVKGKREPLTVSLVLGRLQVRSPALTTLFAHPLVGREAELAQMERVMEAVLDRAGQVLRLEGEAGQGKSHLAVEFVGRTSDRGFRVTIGVCQSTGQTVPYYPWRQVLRALLELSDEPAGGEDQLAWIAREIAQVEAIVNQTNPGWFPRLPLLGDLLGLPIPDTPTTAAFDPQVRQQALIALTVEMIQAWAQTRPILLLFEDMRWIDGSSLELILALGRSIVQSSVLLFLAHRPPIRADQALLPDLNRLSYYHHLDLSELSPQGVAALVANRLRGQPSPLVLSLIQTQAQGNPFYTEELVDTLRESEALYPEQDDTWVLSRAMVGALREAKCLTRAKEQGQWTLVSNAPLATANLGIPDSIHGVVLTRLDRLPEDYKLSLKVASVIGRVFEFDLLAQSHPNRHPRGTLREQIREMETRDFTRLEVPPPQLVYMFKHNITQEVVYGTLLRDQERELHRAIGEALEELLPEAVERLAYHLYEGQVWDKALFYNLDVARNAQRGFANDIAVEAYRRALEAAAKADTDTGSAQLLIYESLGEVLTLVGRYDEALDAYAQARALVMSEPARHLADLCRKTAEVYERRSEYDVAFEWLEQGLDCLDESISSVEATRIYSLQAGVCYRQGKMDDALARSQKCLAVASGIESREGRQVVAQANYLLGNVYFRRGDMQRAVRLYRESVDVYQQIDDIAGQARAYNNLGNASRALGDLGQASDAFSRSLEISREIGDIQLQGLVTNNLGNIYLSRGEWTEAATYFEESNGIWRQLGAAVPEAATLLNLSQVYIRQGNWSEARDCLGSSQAIFAEIGVEVFLPELERHWAELYLGTDALDEALAHIDRSIELAMAHEARLEEGLSRRVLGQVRLARGEKGAAETSLRQSLEILYDLDNEYEATKTALALARLILEEDRPEAEAQLAQAIQTFEKLGAEADLAEALALKHRLET